MTQTVKQSTYQTEVMCFLDIAELTHRASAPPPTGPDSHNALFDTTKIANDLKTQQQWVYDISRLCAQNEKYPAHFLQLALSSQLKNPALRNPVRAALSPNRARQSIPLTQKLRGVN